MPIDRFEGVVYFVVRRGSTVFFDGIEVQEKRAISYFRREVER